MPSQANASHILVKTEAEAKDLLARIQSGESLEQLAQQFSLCPSGKSGGSLGSFGRGMMVPEFEEVCFSGKTGLVEKPIKTQFGWHLIKINSIQ